MPADKPPYGDEDTASDGRHSDPAANSDSRSDSSSNSSSDNSSRGLLGDLQNIRTLLDESEPAAADDSVPLLDDPLPNAQSNSPISPDVFDRLLGDDWKDQADHVLQGARHRIDESAANWSPEDTDALNDALRVRIDETIQDWLQQMLTERIGELRTRVLTAMADEINLRVNEPLEDLEPTNLLDAIRQAPRKDTDGS